MFNVLYQLHGGNQNHVVGRHSQPMPHDRALC